MTGKKIGHARLVLPDGIYPDGQICFSGGKIVKILQSQERGLTDSEMDWDLQGDFLIPGLIDTHVHGAGGFDTMDGTFGALHTIRTALLSQGTTAFLATTMSAAPERTLHVLSVMASELQSGPGAGGQGRAESSGTAEPAGLGRAVDLEAQTEETGAAGGRAEFLGVHMEGPFLSLNYKGAQALGGIWPEDSGGAADFVQRIAVQFPGLVRVLTLAPERADARELIACCLANGILPSAGHSAASYEKMQEAIEWGLHRVTHAFNAMPGIHHRQPGLLTASLEDDRISLEIIADAVHIHPSILRLVLQVKPEGGVTLVSDGTRAVGMADGEYELGGQRTFVQHGVARLADGTIAGSAYPLLQGIRTLAADHYPLYLAVKAATLNPARMLGVDARLGSLAVGKEATFLRLSPELEVLQVWQRGLLVLDHLTGHRG